MISNAAKCMSEDNPDIDVGYSNHPSALKASLCASAFSVL